MPAPAPLAFFLLWSLTLPLFDLFDALRHELGLFLLSFPTRDDGEGEDYVTDASSKSGTRGMGLCSTSVAS